MSNGSENRKINDLISDLKSSDLDTRQKAAYDLHILSEGNSEEVKIAIPSLKEAINDPDWVVRKMSIMALGELDVREEIPRIIEFLKDDATPEVRVGAAEALGDMKVEEAVEPLLLALDDSYEMLRQVSIWSLAKIGKKSTTAVPKIIECMLKPDIIGIAQTNNLAAWALGEIGDKTAIEPLKKALNEVEYSERKFIVAYSLALLEGADGIGYAEMLKMKEDNQLLSHEIEDLNELIQKFS